MIKYSEKKSLHQVSKCLDVKQNTVICILGAAKLNRKEIRTGIVLWYSPTKRQDHKKLMNE